MRVFLRSILALCAGIFLMISLTACNNSMGPTPTKCPDPAATNYGANATCTYPAPPTSFIHIGQMLPAPGSTVNVASSFVDVSVPFGISQADSDKKDTLKASSIVTDGCLSVDGATCLANFAGPVTSGSSGSNELRLVVNSISDHGITTTNSIITWLAYRFADGRPDVPFGGAETRAVAQAAYNWN